MTSLNKYCCPRCHVINTDDWPLNIKGQIIDGGCQNCWEKECDDAWWVAVVSWDKMLHLEEQQPEGGENPPEAV